MRINVPIKYLLNNLDSKQRFIRWMLSINKIDLEIKDKKGTENFVADHLPRLVNDEVTNSNSRVAMVLLIWTTTKHQMYDLIDFFFGYMT